MLAAAVVVAREVFEMALVIGIVMAATRGLAGRGQWVMAGVGVGTASSLAVAAAAGTIAAAAAGMGQELFNAAVLFAAVAMLGWHNVWMGRHGRDLACKMSETGRAVAVGQRPLYVLTAVVGLAVLREGSEIVLFLYGLVLGSGAALAETMAGSAFGLAAGAAAGFLLYFGLLRIPTRLVFTLTGWMILLLAAGMAAQGAGYLVQARILPALGRRVWDSSELLPEASLPGQFLHTLVGYADRPNGMQIVFYVAALLIIGIAMRRWGAPDDGVKRPAAERA